MTAVVLSPAITRAIPRRRTDPCVTDCSARALEHPRECLRMEVMVVGRRQLSVTDGAPLVEAAAAALVTSRGHCRSIVSAESKRSSAIKRSNRPMAIPRAPVGIGNARTNCATSFCSADTRREAPASRS